MSSLSFLAWALDLRGTSPIEKLVAIYFGSRAGTVFDDTEDYGLLEATAHDMADWCGCKKEDVDVALDVLRGAGLTTERVDIWLYRMRLPLQREPTKVIRDRGRERIHIYVISTASGTKIGITADPTARLKSLRASTPEAVTVEFIGAGERRIIEWAEARCHADLRLENIRGEWFSCEPARAVAVVRAVLEEGGIKPP